MWARSRKILNKAGLTSLLIIMGLLVASCGSSVSITTTPASETATGTVTVSVGAGNTPDWTKLGFSTVLTSQDIDPETPMTLTAGPLVLDILSGTFDGPVKLDVLSADINIVKAKAPTGMTPVIAFALRVTNRDTGQLIGKFNKVIMISASSSSITPQSMYNNLSTDGIYTPNPTGLDVKAGELTHPVQGATVAWVITSPEGSGRTSTNGTGTSTSGGGATGGGAPTGGNY